MTGELTTAVCPLCAAGTTAVIRPRRDGYAYLRFQRCGLGRIDPMPGQAGRPLSLEAMTDVVKDARSRYDGCRVVRTPIAYPVFSNSYEPARRTLETSTRTSNLLSVGRNGEFAHILIEHVCWHPQNPISSWLETESRSFEPSEPRILPRSAPSPTHVGHLDRTGSV